jgi:hypothetical protein
VRPTAVATANPNFELYERNWPTFESLLCALIAVISEAFPGPQKLPSVQLTS